MSWQVLLELICDEAGPAVADRIEARCKRELAGVRITVGSRSPLTAAELDKALRQARGNVQEAAKLLGVAPSTIYRTLNARIAKPKPRPAVLIR